MKLQPEYVRAYGKVTISRKELLTLGFDTNDAFYVQLDSHYDGHGITFTLHQGTSEKYLPNPEPEVAPKPKKKKKKKFWLWSK